MATTATSPISRWHHESLLLAGRRSRKSFRRFPGPTQRAAAQPNILEWWMEGGGGKGRPSHRVLLLGLVRIGRRGGRLHFGRRSVGGSVLHFPWPNHFFFLVAFVRVQFCCPLHDNEAGKTRRVMGGGRQCTRSNFLRFQVLLDLCFLHRFLAGRYTRRRCQKTDKSATIANKTQKNCPYIKNI